MAMTRAQLRAAVRDNLLEPAPARWTDSFLNRMLSDGQRDLADVAQERHLESLTVAAGQATVAVPSTLHVIEAMWWEEGGSRTPLRWAEWPVVPNAQTQGRPQALIRDGGTLRPWPIPQQAGTLLLRGIREPVDFADDNATGHYPDADEALIAYATWKAFAADGDPQRETWLADYGQRKAVFAVRQLEQHKTRSVIRDVYGELNDAVMGENVFIPPVGW